MITLYGYKVLVRLAGLLLLLGYSGSGLAQGVKPGTAAAVPFPGDDPTTSCTTINLQMTGNDADPCTQVSLIATNSDGCSLTYYLKLNGNTVAVGSGQTVPFDVTQRGSYVVTSGTNLVSAPVDVTSIPATPTINASRSLVMCPGDYVDLTASAGASYRWNTGATTASIRVTVAGTYYVAVTNSANCSATATPVAVSMLVPDVTVTSNGSTTFCSGGSRTLSVPLANGNSYQWRLNGNDITGANAASYAATASGNYSVWARSMAGCEATSTGMMLTTTPIPQLAINTTPGSAPDYATGLTATLSSSGANATYSWAPTTGLLSSSTAASIRVRPSTSVTYTVTATTTAGCVITQSVTVPGNGDRKSVV